LLFDIPTGDCLLSDTRYDLYDKYDVCGYDLYDKYDMYPAQNAHFVALSPTGRHGYVQPHIESIFYAQFPPKPLILKNGDFAFFL
jgi:hypothetical protein